MKSKLFVTSVTAILASSLAYAQGSTSAAAVPAAPAAAAQPATAASSTQTTDKAVITKTEQPAKTETIMLPSGKKTITTRTTTTTIKPLAGASTTKVEAKPEESKAKFGLGIGTSYTMGAEANAKGERKQVLGLEFTPSIGMGNYTLLGVLGYEQDLVDTTAPGWGDPVLILSRKAWDLGSYFKAGPSLQVLIPTTDAMRDDTQMITQIRLGVGFSLKMAEFGLDNWSFKYTPSYARNFTKYDTSAVKNEPLTMHNLRNQFDAGYNITDSLSLSARFRLNSNYSANGVVSNSFLTFQSLGYSIDDNLSVSLTHTNEGAGLNKAKDYENNIKLYNPESSEYSFGVDVSL